MTTSSYQDILSFWFKEISPESWWEVKPEFDEVIRNRFMLLLHKTARGECFEWRTHPEGRLAEIIVLDQFSRNIYRGTPRAFSQDAIALVLAQEAVSLGAHRQLSPIERSFMLMPYMHSESGAIHVQAEVLYREYAPENNYNFELRHKAIIDRFGRYPHRNEILGRTSTSEELEFLEQPGSSF
ncbi:MAG: DUF924 family protein [Arenimonas sp.]